MLLWRTEGNCQEIIKKYSCFTSPLPLRKFKKQLKKNSCVFQVQSTLVISNFTGPDKNVRVISSLRQPNCDVIGMTTVRLCSPKRAWKARVYGNLNNLCVLQFAKLFVLGDAMVLLE